MNPIATRLLSQQLICPQFDTPQKVVSHFGAMQAQDYRMVRWAVMMRTRKPSSFAFKNAYDEGEIVDVDKYGVTASQYRIQSVPTLMLFRNGEVLWRTSGVVDKAELLATLDPFLI